MCARVGAFFQCELGRSLHDLTLYGPVDPDSLAGGAFPASPTAPVASQTSASSAPGSHPRVSLLFLGSLLSTLSPFWAILGSLPTPTSGGLPGLSSRQLLGQCKALQKIYEEQ